MVTPVDDAMLKNDPDLGFALNGGWINRHYGCLMTKLLRCQVPVLGFYMLCSQIVSHSIALKHTDDEVEKRKHMDEMMSLIDELDLVTGNMQGIPEAERTDRLLNGYMYGLYYEPKEGEKLRNVVIGGKPEVFL